MKPICKGMREKKHQRKISRHMMKAAGEVTDVISHFSLVDSSFKAVRCSSLLLSSTLIQDPLVNLPSFPYPYAPFFFTYRVPSAGWMER